MTGFIVAMLVISLVGCTGLTTCAPRPRAQEFWATITVAPLFILIGYIVLNAGR